MSDHFNLTAHVLARAVDLEDKSALQILKPSGAERWQYGRLLSAVRGAGAGFLAAGLMPGDRVLLRLGNTTDFPIAFLGAIAVGIIPVPTSAQLTGPEITKMAQQLDITATVAQDGVALPDQPGILISTEELRGFEALPPCDYAYGSSDRLAYIIFTSGSAGLPRAVCHAHRAILARHAMYDGWYGLRETDRLLHAGAFNWTYTLGTGLLDPWTMGATALIPSAAVRPDQIPLLLKRVDATIFAAVPGVYRQILKAHSSLALPKLRHGLSAGEKLPTALRSAWHDATGTPIHEAFGMSECSTFISGSPIRPSPEDTLGFIQPDRKVRIAPQGSDNDGEIQIHRDEPGLFLGYWGAKDETTARFDGDWFRTGDMARMDAAGAVHYLGRNDDMMNAGGFRVSPIEVENALQHIDDIGDIAAIEVPVKPGVTVIALAYSGGVDETVLIAHAQETLARYKQPRIYRQILTLPRNANGKIDRRKLRQDWAASH
ncbi:benzoate--CoA ligase [Thioclava sp. SK-1]|uniref:class I adenylate-forming enzyme family protein n=1 Tax=Thioclava sp. SK-1 TaxID=1889770 RepID=UPI000824C641|nr:class I adenylate-forming enzyme family protein [Thioclava sp. SK-1]OCX63137.1 benzoate--CoA ligase [Thioclava sp. SK-1]